MFLLLVGTSIAQISVQTRPSHAEWIKIHPAAGEWSYLSSADGRDTCDVTFNIGAGTTLWFVTDTVVNASAAAIHDSSMTVYLELYNDLAGMWGSHSGGASAMLAARLDSVDRALVNRTNSGWYMVLDDYTEYAWGNKARVWYHIGDADSIRVKVFVGGIQ